MGQRLTDPSKSKTDFPSKEGSVQSPQRTKLSPKKAEVKKLLQGLLKEYTERIKDERNDVDIIFKRQFVQDLVSILTKYVNKDFQSQIDIEATVKESLNSETREGLIKQTEDIILQAIKSISKIDLRRKKTVQLSDILKDSVIIDKVQVNKEKVKQIIENLYDKSSPPSVQKFKDRLKKESFRHTRKIINLYGGFMNKMLPKAMTESQKKKIQKNSMFKPLKKTESAFNADLDPITIKRGKKVVNNLYTILLYNALMGCLVRVGNTIKSFTKMLKSIMAMGKKFAVGIISRTFNLFSTFIINPIYKAISVPVNLILSLSKKIFGNLKEVVKESKIGAIFLTPVGMYTLGVICGFIWDRLKRVMKKTTFDPASFVKQVFNLMGQGWNTAIKFLEDKFPTTMGIIEWTFGLIKDVFSPVFNMVKDILTGKYSLGDVFKDITKRITELVEVEVAVWKPIVKTAVYLFNFCRNHPKLSSALGVIIYGAVKLFKNWSWIKRIANTGKAVVNTAGISSVGIFSVLGGMIASYGTATVTEQMINLAFKSRTDKELSVGEKNENELIKLIDSFDDDKLIFMDQDSIKKIRALRNMMNYEIGNFREYRRDIGNIGKNVGEKEDINDKYGALVKDILDQPWVTQKDRDRYYKETKRDDQLNVLNELLNGRQQIMIAAYEKLHAYRPKDLVKKKGKNKTSLIDDIYSMAEYGDANLLMEMTKGMPAFNDQFLTTELEGDFSIKSPTSGVGVDAAFQKDRAELLNNRIAKIRGFVDKIPVLKDMGERERELIIKRMVYTGDVKKMKDLMSYLYTKNFDSADETVSGIIEDMKKIQTPQSIIEEYFKEQLDSENKKNKSLKILIENLQKGEKYKEYTKDERTKLQYRNWIIELERRYGLRK